MRGFKIVYDFRKINIYIPDMCVGIGVTAVDFIGTEIPRERKKCIVKIAMIDLSVLFS